MSQSSWKQWKSKLKTALNKFKDRKEEKKSQKDVQQQPSEQHVVAATVDKQHQPDALSRPRECTCCAAAAAQAFTSV